MCVCARACSLGFFFTQLLHFYTHFELITLREGTETEALIIWQLVRFQFGTGCSQIDSDTIFHSVYSYNVRIRIFLRLPTNCQLI